MKVQHEDCIHDSTFAFFIDQIKKQLLNYKCELSNNNIFKLNIYNTVHPIVMINNINDEFKLNSESECKLSNKYLNCNYAYNTNKRFLLKNNFYQTYSASKEIEIYTKLVDSSYLTININENANKVSLKSI